MAAGVFLGPIVGGSFTNGTVTRRWIGNPYRLSITLTKMCSYLKIRLSSSIQSFSGHESYLLVLVSVTSTSTRDDFHAADQESRWSWKFLTAGLYVPFTMAFSFGGAIWTWNDNRVVVLIVVSSCHTIIFSC